MQVRLHLLYANLEEKYGLAKNVLRIFQEGTEAVNWDNPQMKAPQKAIDLKVSYCYTNSFYRFVSFLFFI